MEHLQKEQFLILLEKYQSGNAAPEEVEFLDAYYMAFSLKPAFTASLQEQERLELKDDLLTSIKADISGLKSKKKNTVKNTLRRWMIPSAAAVLLLAGAGLYYYQYLQQTFPVIPPGRNGATLTLGSGQQIRLSDALKGQLAREAGISISKTADGQLIYEIKDAAQAAANVMNTLSTAKGEQYAVTLPDGSKVWLNAASTLKYPASFKGQAERKLELTGEAYFEVAKDKLHPFIVTTENQEVKVLGTHFNISSYPEEGNTKTTLLEGSVRVAVLQKSAVPSEGGIAILEPDQQAILSHHHIDVIPVNAVDAIDWKNGEFVFKNEKLSSVMRKISRWYNLEVVFQDDNLDTRTFSGSVSRYDSVAEVLKTLELTGRVHFKMEGKKIIVMK